MRSLPRAQPILGGAQQKDDHPTSHARISLQITRNLRQRD